MCQKENRIESTKYYRTLWSLQPQPTGDFADRLERCTDDVNFRWSEEYRRQFNTVTFVNVTSGAEIIEQEQRNPPFTVAREFTIHS